MRKFCTLAILLLYTLCANTNPITQKQALQRAQSFADNLQRKANVQLKMAYSSLQSNKEASYYIYNIGHKNGFVVVSGDDNTDAILGYTDQGDFNYDQMPENMKAWLDSYEQQLSIISRHGKTIRRINSVHPTTVIEPLITTTWAQTAPYNTKCPEYEGAYSKTGCTATAMAQVMRYHQYPTGKTTKIPAYTTGTLKISMPILPATTFNWSKMPEILTEDSPQDEIDEVAKLMLYCGQATKMNYTPEGSGAFSYEIPDCLPEYFGYAKTMHYIYRNSYDEASWDSLLVQELVNNRPVIYTAYTNLGQGHTFICDGYDGNGMYHLNWGWNGVGNGYFRISVAHAKDDNLNEEIKNYHLSMKQTAIVGLKVAGEDEYVAPTKFYRAYSRPSLKNGRTYTRTSTKLDFTNITFKQSFVNTYTSTKKLSHGVALYSEDGEIVSLLSSSTANLSAGSSKNYEVSNLSFGKGIEEGHYYVKAVYKHTSTSNWAPMAGTEKNYIDVVITDTLMTLTPVPKADFKVNSLKKEDSYLSINMENMDEEFYGPIYLRVKDSTTNVVTQISYDNLSFDAASSTTFDLYIDDDINFDLQNDLFYLSTDEYDSQYFYSSAKEINYDLNKSITILNQNEETGDVIGDRIMCNVIIENIGSEPYNDDIILTLTDSATQVVSTIEKQVELPAGEKNTIYCEIEITDFNTTYVLTASYKKNTFTQVDFSTDTLTVSKGGIYWTKDGSVKTQKASYRFVVPEEALAVNLHNAYTGNVTPNSNPNTIYMLNKTVPKGLVGKNYVSASNKGDKLTLTDAYDYFIPTDLSFSGTITYERSFTSEDSLQLSTISLPFAPSAVMLDNQEISWKTSAEDDTHPFWLMAFEGVTDSIAQIVTSYASTIKENTPYFIVPDSQLVNKTIVFQANKLTLHPTLENEQIASTDSCALIGLHCQQSVANSYVLSDNRFVYTDEGIETNAFRAYLTADSLVSNKNLTVDFYENIAPHIQPESVKGDVNGDGVIDISDVLLTVDHIVGHASEGFIIENADINDDEVIDISDVLLIVDLVLSN